jgi:hypothetical protein
MDNALGGHEELLQLQALVQRGMQGDREVLPTLRTLLDTQPALWTEVGTLITEVEQSWLQLLTGDDLVTREVLLRQLQAWKAELAGPQPTPLERLLCERIAVCWLQAHQAELWAVQHIAQPDAWSEQRQDRAQARFLAAIKALAQVRKLLQPRTTVQVNIAQQQVNMG